MRQLEEGFGIVATVGSTQAHVDHNWIMNAIARSIGETLYKHGIPVTVANTPVLHLNIQGRTANVSADMLTFGNR